MNTTDLRDEFYRSFDATRITDLLAKLSEMSESDRRKHPHFLGEGTHFQSFALSASPMPIAVNVAKQSFTKRGPQELERWRHSVSELRMLETKELVPPIEVVQYANLTAIIMPKGSPLTRKGAVARSLDDKLQETSRALGKAGLVLDDYPQLVEYDGHYFINDWSDLKAQA